MATCVALFMMTPCHQVELLQTAFTSLADAVLEELGAYMVCLRLQHCYQFLLHMLGIFNSNHSLAAPACADEIVLHTT